MDNNMDKEKTTLQKQFQVIGFSRAEGKVYEALLTFKTICDRNNVDFKQRIEKLIRDC